METVKITKNSLGFFVASWREYTDGHGYVKEALALLITKAKDMPRWLKQRLVVLCDDYDLAAELAPGNVTGLKILLDEGYVDIQTIPAQFKYPADATKKWRVTRKGEERVVHVWKIGGDDDYPEHYSDYEGSQQFVTPVYTLPEDWLLVPEEVTWELVEETDNGKHSL